MDELVRNPVQLGNIVRRARKAKGLSQSELGRLAGMRQATVSEIETGHAALRLDTLLSLVSALDLDLKVGTRGGDTDLPDLEELLG